MLSASKVLLVSYGEIALRGNNRKHFEHNLLDKIRARLDEHHSARREQGRFVVFANNGDVAADVLGRIENIFGLISFSHALMLPILPPDDLATQAADFFAPFCGGASFKVITRRADKNYPLKSNEISALVGGMVLERVPDARVDLHNPQVRLHVELRTSVYFFCEAKKGLGGLPYNTGGSGMLMLSGGIDSPVAGWLMARRGVGLRPVYFHSPPYVSERARHKVQDLCRALAVYTGEITLTTVNFTKIQLYLKQKVDLKKLQIFLRRAMMHIASKLAHEHGAKCIITGDSVGQVASQTLAGIFAIDSAASLPVIRPLAGYDKQDIINISNKIGTFEISARPYDDCCAVFVAKHPETRPHAPSILRMWNTLLPGLDALVEEAVGGVEVEGFL